MSQSPSGSVLHRARTARFGVAMLLLGVIGMTFGALAPGASAESGHERTYWFEFADDHTDSGVTSQGDAEVHGMTIHVSCSDTFADGYSDFSGGHPNLADDGAGHKIVDYYVIWKKDGELFKTCGNVPGSSTTTTTESTTTTTESTTTTTLATTTTLDRASVGGVIEERSAPPPPAPAVAAEDVAVKGVTLARTGSEPTRWVFFAGLAFFAGGLAILFGEAAPRPSRR